MLARVYFQWQHGRISPRPRNPKDGTQTTQYRPTRRESETHADHGDHAEQGKEEPQLHQVVAVPRHGGECTTSRGMTASSRSR